MRRAPSFATLAVIALLTAGSLAGCGGDDDSSADPSSATSGTEGSGGSGDAAEAVLGASDNEFSPVAARPGQKVRLVSGDPVPHTVVSVDGAWEFDEATMTFTAPDEPGRYEFFCGVHGKGMSGTLTVEA